MRQLFLEVGVFSPPPPSPRRPPCSLPSAVHYSFDMAQQVHYLSDPLQPAPIYFLTPRKCGIFGVCCEAIPRQINYLIDEASDTGKVSNTIVSMLHHFFEEHSLGESIVHLHADNCVGQNKNNVTLPDLAGDGRAPHPNHPVLPHSWAHEVLSRLVLRSSEAAVSPNEGWLSGRPRTGRQHLSRGQRCSARRHPVGRGGGPDLQLDINVCRATQETEPHQEVPPLQDQCFNTRLCVHQDRVRFGRGADLSAH